MLMKMRSYQHNSESHSATLSGFSHAASQLMLATSVAGKGFGLRLGVVHSVACQSLRDYSVVNG